MQDCCIYQGLESGTSNRCELEGSILSAGEVELMPRLLDLLATRDADENMKNAHRALWKYEQVKSEDEISPIQGSSARSKPKSCACMYNSWWHGGVVGLTLANGVSTPSTIAQAPTLFHVRRLRTQVSASNRQSRSSICIIPHYTVSGLCSSLDRVRLSSVVLVN